MLCPLLFASGCWSNIFPEPSLDEGDSQVGTSFRRRCLSAVEDGTGEFAIELRAIVFAVQAPHACPTLVGAKWVVDAFAPALCRVIEPDAEPLLEQRGQPPDPGLRVPIRVEDACERAGEQVLPDAILAETAPLYVP